MTMYRDNYYIMQQGADGQYNCLLSYKDIEETKQHAKKVTEQLNKTCLIVKPIYRIAAITRWAIEDLN